MIDYIAGKKAELTPTACVLDCNGIGYEINITLIDYPKLEQLSDTKLYIFESIREDAHILFGFLEKEARALFRLLITVSGVGPNTARLILSSLTVNQLEESISTGNTAALKSVKGIGTRTAERIIVDLKDKINVTQTTLSVSGVASNETFGDSLQALVMLGFTKMQSEKILKKIFATQPSASTEEAIKQALKMM
ncbi:MAG: Holliday junction branch migration protein RuvA [Muribaculum sp.]|nr:Holliday junction branch migration protein RuvA [Muribaculum sp.]